MTETETVPEAAVPPEIPHGDEAQLRFELGRLRERLEELHGERAKLWKAVVVLWADARLRDYALGNRYGEQSLMDRMREVERVYAFLSAEGVQLLTEEVGRVEAIMMSQALGAHREALRVFKVGTHV